MFHHKALQINTFTKSRKNRVKGFFLKRSYKKKNMTQLVIKSCENIILTEGQLMTYVASGNKILRKYFPNKNKSGVYFDLITLSIVKQAENYSNVQKFIEHCQNSGYNASLNKKLGRFPIYDYLKVRSRGPKFHTSQIDDLLQYHDVLSRMFDKLN